MGRSQTIGNHGPVQRPKPKRIVLKIYGRDSILFGLVSPIFAALMAGRTGTPRRLECQTRMMENDANDMAKEGYRIVSSREYNCHSLASSITRCLRADRRTS